MPAKPVQRKSKLTNDIRRLIIQNYNDGKNEAEISQIFNIPKATITSIVRIYKRDGRVERLGMGGPRIIKVTDEIKDFVRRKVDEKCDFTLNQLSKFVLEDFNVSLSHTTISNLLKDLHYSFKKIKVVTERSISADIIEQRRTYSQAFQDLIAIKDERNIFFIDEVGVNLCMRSKYGYAPVGKSPVRVAPGIRSRNISICCAMNKNGNIFFKDQSYAFNSKDFTSYINDLLLWVNSMNLTQCSFVMDNVPFHKNTAVREIIVNSGHELIFLPPYSPQFNPIENMFSKWKDCIRRREPRTAAELNDLINRGVEMITPEDCSGFFRNMLREMRNIIE